MLSNQLLLRVRILLIESDRDTANLFSFVLWTEGANVTVASSISEALIALNANQFDIILIEPKLPDGEGYRVVKALRRGELGNSQHLPVVVISASVRQVDQEQARAAECQVFLSKPIDSLKLIDVVYRLAIASPTD
jgi:CheY-like chemotaxis protein